MKRIFIGLYPTFDSSDYKNIRQLLFKKSDTEKRDIFRDKLSEFLPEGDIFLTESARSSFHLLLKSLELAEDSEVILPAFTCVVIVNPVLWAGLKPVYVDIEEKDFNTPVSGLIDAVTPNTKLILVQHTFGNYVDIKLLKSELSRIGRSDIILVEDLAHVFGSNVSKNEYVDASILTFGVEKTISTIRGGALFISKNSTNLKNSLEKVKSNYEKYSELGFLQYLKLILNPIFWQIILPIYDFGVGKITIGRLFVLLVRRLGLLGIAISKTEYSGGQPSHIETKIQPKFAEIGIKQLEKMPDLVKLRKNLTKIYSKKISNTKFAGNIEQRFIVEKVNNRETELAFLRYPLLLDNIDECLKFVSRTKKLGITVGDWYKTMFYTPEENYSELGYTKGSCPIAESVTRRIVNLPINSEVDERIVEKIIDVM